MAGPSGEERWKWGELNFGCRRALRESGEGDVQMGERSMVLWRSNALRHIGCILPNWVLSAAARTTSAWGFLECWGNPTLRFMLVGPLVDLRPTTADGGPPICPQRQGTRSRAPFTYCFPALRQKHGFDSNNVNETPVIVIISCLDSLAINRHEWTLSEHNLTQFGPTEVSTA